MIVGAVAGGVARTMLDRAVGGAAETASAAAGDFGQMITRLASETVETLKSAETTAVDALTGKTLTQNAVAKLMEAERALQFSIAVRDKTVAAYQEISRMAI